MIKFCFECGKKLEYSFSPPNFCPSCGTAIQKNKVSKPKKPSKSFSSSVDEDGYTNSDQIPNISRLEFEIEDYGSNVQHTIGSLGGKSLPKKQKRVIKNITDL